MEHLLTVLEWRADLLVFACVATAITWLILRGLRQREVEANCGPAWTAVALIVVMAALAAEVFGERERHRLQAMLEGHAPTYAAELERMDYASIGVDTSPDDPTYLQMIERQRDWLQRNCSVNNIYTFGRTSSGSTVLLVDSETDYDGNGVYEGDREQRTAIGEEYEVSDNIRAGLDQAFAGATTFSGSIDTDRWGSWVSAYAPIRGKDGEVLGVLGVDFAATTWVSAILSSRFFALALFTVLVAVTVAGFTWLHLSRSQLTRQFLLDRNEALERANRELTIANKTVEAAARAKSEFLTNMSHEIRTPMTAILGFSDLLEDEATTAEERREFLQTIRRSGTHLLTLIDDILNFSKLDAGKMTFERQPCSPWQIASDVVALLRDQATRKGVALELTRGTDVPASVTSDSTRLRQVLLNLVGNAVKFTSQGKVALHLELTRRDGEPRLQFVVSDTGIGIGSVALQKLFQPFVQADGAVTRQFGGTGLGLAISARLVAGLGGRISCDSKPGVGSTFTIELPAIDSSETRLPPVATDMAPRAAASSKAPTVAFAPMPTGAAVAPATPRLRVLLAEDLPDNQRLITAMLRRAGVDLQVVNNGRECVEAVQGAGTGGFDLVLMDMQMPEMDGYEATRQLRAAGFLRPIIAVTAHALEGDREKCLAAGCDDYTKKPLQQQLLIEKIAGCVKHPSRDQDSDRG